MWIPDPSGTPIRFVLEDSSMKGARAPQIVYGPLSDLGFGHVAEAL